MNKLIEYFVKQGAFVNIVTVMVFLAGGWSLFNINREVFPNIQFDVITVTTAYPGGAAESLERLVTNPLEQALREVDGIKKMTSYSVEGQSVIALQLDPDQTTANEAKLDIDDVISNITSLPEGVEDPKVTIMESKRQPVIDVSLSGEVEEAELRKTAKFLERELEKLNGVAQVSFTGMRELEIRIEAHVDKLKKFRISLPELVNALQKNNINIPGGVSSADTGPSREIIIRTIGEYQGVEDVGDTVIRANALGRSIRVKDVCAVTMTFAKEKYRYKTNGSRSLNLKVLRKQHSDAITLVNNIRQTIAEQQSNINPAIKVSFIDDVSYYVKRRLQVLTNNMAIGLVLVLVILALILPLPIALVTVFGIPFAFLAVVAIFHFGNISLNLISMMGLIIVVGMLVDDAIVITENAQRFIEDGLNPEEAAIKGTQRIWAPVTASVMTTVIVFAPMMIMSGIFGKFVYYIPLAVIISLLVSLWECFFILPHHVASWVKVSNLRNGKAFFSEKIWQPLIERPYLYVLNGVLKLRYLVILAALALFAGMVYLAKEHVGFVLFPPGGVYMFSISFQADTGASLNETARLLRPYEDYLASLPDSEVEDFISTVGRQGMENPRSMKRGAEYAQIMVYLTDALTRARDTSAIIEDVRGNVQQPEGLKVVSFRQVAGGPPVGKAVSISVRGDEYAHILPAVRQLEEQLHAVEGVTDVENSHVSGKDEIRVRVKQEAAAAALLSLQDIGMAVRAAFEGIVATAIRNLDEEINLRVMLHQGQRQGTQALADIEIPNRRGQLIPLPKVAEWETTSGVSVYEHENNQRQVTVEAEIDSKVTNSGKVNSLMQEKVTALATQHPALSFHFGGEDSDTKESLASLKVTFVFALLGIIFLLTLLFKNLYQPFIIATTIPLGILATIFAFYVHGITLSFLAMIGIIALAGVVVNNAIVFVDFINSARQRGLEKAAAIKDAARRRLRPIFLTTITTSAGILPTAYGFGGLDPFVVPIALALGWGILGGALLTVLVLPAVVRTSDDVASVFRKIFSIGRASNASKRVI